jgi:hypothetical protein
MRVTKLVIAPPRWLRPARLAVLRCCTRPDLPAQEFENHPSSREIHGFDSRTSCFLRNRSGGLSSGRTSHAADLRSRARPYRRNIAVGPSPSAKYRSPSVRIFALELGRGAMGIRTPDLLHAISRQPVQGGASAQVTVLTRAPQCALVRTGCGTSVLYPLQDGSRRPPGWKAPRLSATERTLKLT